MNNPRVIDNDVDEIKVSLDGEELRSWYYASESERREKIIRAQEYVEGWCDGFDRGDIGLADIA